MRIFLSILAFVVIVIIAGTVFLISAAEGMITAAVPKYGSPVMGTDVKLESVDLDFFDGKVDLGGLSVAQPEGFGEGNAFAFDRFALALDPAALTGNYIQMDSIVMDGLNINAVLKGRELNISKINDHMQTYIPPDDGTPTSDEILMSAKSITLSNMKLSFQMNDGKKHELALADMTLTDVGVSENGVPPKDMMRHVMAALQPQIQKAAVKLGLRSQTDKLKEKIAPEVKKLKKKAGGLFDKLEGEVKKKIKGN